MMTAERTKPLKSFAKNVLSGIGIYVSRTAPERLEDHLRALIGKLRINCVLDVGAHRGEFGRTLREIGYKSRIVSFEPVSAHFKVLVEQAMGDAQWKMYPFALGEQDTECDINLYDGTTFASLLSPSEYGKQSFPDKMHPVGRERIRTRRLEGVFDDCIRGIDDVRVLLKTDCQGFDLHVIRGAGERLAGIDAIQCEVSLNPIYTGMTNTVSQVFPALLEAGFCLTGSFPVTRDKNDGLSIVELDCVFFRPRPRG